MEKKKSGFSFGSAVVMVKEIAETLYLSCAY